MKENKALLAVKIDPAVAERVRHFCRERGLKYGFFVEKAVVEKMAFEELKEDIVDLKNLRNLEDKAVPLDHYVKKRRV